MKLVESLAKAAGAAIGSSRPVAETLKYLPLNRYVPASLMTKCGFKKNLSRTPQGMFSLSQFSEKIRRNRSFTLRPRGSAP